MKVHKEGTGLLLMLFTICFIVDLTLYHTIGMDWRFYLTTGVTSIFFLLVLNFFRSPSRRFPYDSEGLVIAPADGTIVAIEEVKENEILHKDCLQISIFMSVFNVHANWFPVNGTVKHVSHQNGRFMAAYLPKSSTENITPTVLEIVFTVFSFSHSDSDEDKTLPPSNGYAGKRLINARAKFALAQRSVYA